MITYFFQVRKSEDKFMSLELKKFIKYVTFYQI